MQLQNIKVTIYKKLLLTFKESYKLTYKITVTRKQSISNKTNSYKYKKITILTK